jgi:ADP-ribosylglycohydrolase
MTQLGLFDESQNQLPKRNGIPSLDRFQGAILCSTVGDALGWPTEFIDPERTRKPQFELPVSDFIQWRKVVGGKWWGYEEIIAPGDYSDDTQLALAIARCISEIGAFEPERFAYEELPLWLHYERGGGRSVKTAARKLIGKNAYWLRNFYKRAELDYRDAGANGAAMRNLPIALASVGEESQMIKDSFLNAIITHGHPRAIIGTILFGLAVRYALTSSGRPTAETLIEFLRSGIERIGSVVVNDDRIVRWIHDWDNQDHGKEISFRLIFNKTRQEAFNNLEGIRQLMHKAPITYYDFVGALNPATKGSGLATVSIAIYLFLKYVDQPEKALTTAVNTFGSDTDTIAVFLGALLGAYHGLKAVPTHLLGRVQDQDYLMKTAKRLHTIAAREERESWAEDQRVEREDAYLNILTWEIDLHEMFWDAIDIGGVVFHPTLGRGKLTQKVEKPIPREDYVAKLFTIKFDCGQSCVFHSRVEKNERVSESLGQDIERALR